MSDGVGGRAATDGRGRAATAAAAPPPPPARRGRRSRTVADTSDPALTMSAVRSEHKAFLALIRRKY